MTQDRKLKLNDFDEFTKRMYERMDRAHKRYKNDWFFTDMTVQMEEEILDLANYAYLLYRKLKLYREALRKI